MQTNTVLCLLQIPWTWWNKFYSWTFDKDWYTHTGAWQYLHAWERQSCGHVVSCIHNSPASHTDPSTAPWTPCQCLDTHTQEGCQQNHTKIKFWIKCNIGNSLRLKKSVPKKENMKQGIFTIPLQVSTKRYWISLEQWSTISFFSCRYP